MKKSNGADKPWITLGCTKRCYYAKGSKCRCRCKGQNHQRGHMKAPESEEDFKKLVEVKPKNEELSEQLCAILEKALLEHPEWKKYIDETKL